MKTYGTKEYFEHELEKAYLHRDIVIQFLDGNGIPANKTSMIGEILIRLDNDIDYAKDQLEKALNKELDKPVSKKAAGYEFDSDEHERSFE